MADYTLLNLRNDVEDMAPKFQMGEGIGPLRAHAAGLEKSGLSYFKLGPDYRLGFGHTTPSRRRSTWSSAGARG